MKYIITTFKKFAAAKLEEPEMIAAVNQAGGTILSPKEQDGTYGGKTLLIEFADAASVEKAKVAIPQGWKIFPHTTFDSPKTF